MRKAKWRVRVPHPRTDAANVKNTSEGLRAAAAVFLGHGGAEEAEALHLAVEGPRDLAFLLPFPDVRDELPVDEVPRGVADELLLFRQAEIHRAASRGLSCAIRINFRRLRGRTGLAISGPHRPVCAWSGSPTLGRPAGRRSGCKPCTA